MKQNGLPVWLEKYGLKEIEWKGVKAYVGTLPRLMMEYNTGQIDGLPANPREWTHTELNKLEKSIRETPAMMLGRGCLAVPLKGAESLVVLGGNMRLAASVEMKETVVPVIVYPQDTPVETLKQIVIKDNGSFGGWDFDALANEWDDIPLVNWGVPAWDTQVQTGSNAAGDEDAEAAEVERKKKEFEERIAAGEMAEEDEEYQEFLEKFKLKKTTDDCYTPAIVYDAVADWVCKEYGVKKSNFVRPFYPGGDYQKEKYKPTDIVVDNPPFSILAEIMRFYQERGIKFFLFAPHLTQFSSSSSCTCLCVRGEITYENGAVVLTSFNTNLEDPSIRFRSAPTLYRAVQEANDRNLKASRKELPKYIYPPHVVTSPFVARLSQLGIDFVVPCAESVKIRALDSQKEFKKAIFGSGYLVSDRIVAEREKAEREKAEREKAEREKAEREKAEREKAERWTLSDREKAIVAKLNERMGQ